MAPSKDKTHHSPDRAFDSSPADLSQPSSPLTATTPIKILIADDTNTDRLLLQTILSKQGHQVLAASDGEQAVELFRRERPAIVLLDALMPEMDGFEAARAIKQLAGDEFVPVIFLTSLQEADSLARCVDAGGDDFLSKPYNSVILQAKINAFARMRDMHRTVRLQRDEISAHNDRLLREQEVAKRVFDKVAHAGCLDASNIKYALSPIAVFNGDVALAGVTPAGHLVVLLGDFTGHGLDAAIGAMPLAQSFYSMLEKGFSVQDILAEINIKLHEFLPVGVFCCGAVAEIDFKAGTLTAWNGGLPDGYIFRPSTGAITRIRSRHIPFGIRANMDLIHSTETFEVLPGDRLYLWSDGIHEAEDEHRQMFGEDRLLAVFQNNTNPENLFTEINIAVNSFLAESSVGDDISLVEVEIVEPSQFNVELPRFVQSQQAGPRDWSLSYQLRPETLRSFDPLPMLLHVLMHVPYLRSSGGQIYTVMAELYANALEHGVLDLKSAMKDSSEGFTHYYQLRKERLESLADGCITIHLDYKGSVTQGRLVMMFEDTGDGFDHRQFLQRASTDERYSGRGINLLKSICQSVEFSDPGNKVTATFVWGDE